MVGSRSRTSSTYSDFLRCELTMPLQICAELREVLFAPVPATKVKSKRKRIPVEKSGGGV